MIVAFRSLLHMETEGDRRAALRAVHRLLEPGGRLVFDVFAPAPDDISETHSAAGSSASLVPPSALDWDGGRALCALGVRGRGAETLLSLAGRR